MKVSGVGEVGEAEAQYSAERRGEWVVFSFTILAPRGVMEVRVPARDLGYMANQGQFE